MQDPCERCSHFPAGHDVPPVPPVCRSCYWLHFWDLVLPPQAAEHPQTQPFLAGECREICTVEALEEAGRKPRRGYLTP